jgi:hypothetical protein
MAVKAQDVVANASAALGAAADVQAIYSLTALAHCRAARGPFTTEVQSARGGRLRFTQRWPDRTGAFPFDFVTVTLNDVDETEFQPPAELNFGSTL